MNMNMFKKINFTSNEFKFNLCLIACIIVHGSLVVFGRLFKVWPLMIFNIFSVITYTGCLFFVKKHKKSVLYYAFIEIAAHSFLSEILIGHEFGFTMYFILLVSLAYNLLHSIDIKAPIIKATILSLLSFIFYVVCYYISETGQPVYVSEGLQEAAPKAYVINMMLTFAVLMAYSVLFLMETREAFKKLNEKNRELEALANTDPLTGLYNRRVMSEQVKKFYEKYKKDKEPFSLIICDVDDFKVFNDTYGHDCGDIVLKSISKELESHKKNGDYVCRWGGEEFLIMLYGIKVDKARKVAERFRKNIEDMEVNYCDLKIHISMTFGVACVLEAESYNDLFKIADQRLYDGKSAGKNCVR